MPKLKLTGKQLRSIGYPEAPVISIALNGDGGIVLSEDCEDGWSPTQTMETPES